MQFDPRSAWTTRPPAHPLVPWQIGYPVGIAWHYIGAGHASFPTHADCLAWVARTEADEEAGNDAAHDHYSALAYNLCVCPHGHVIEGRGVGAQSGAQLNGNSTWEGVLLMVESADQLTEAMRNAAFDARQYILAHYSFAIRQCGHRDVAGNPSGTSCPGDIVEAWVRAGGAAAPVTPPVIVEPDMHFVPSAPIVSYLTVPGKGAWVLAEDGSVYTLSGTFFGTPFGKPYWAGRQAAQLRPNPSPSTAGSSAHPYVVVATSGEVYGKTGF